MPGILRLRDYRCFRRESPAELQLRSGFTALIGANNAGKSALMRSLYELRGVFQRFSQALTDSLSSGTAVPLAASFGWNIQGPMQDPAEIISERDDAQCTAELVVDNPQPDSVKVITRVIFRFQPDGGAFQIQLFTAADIEIKLENATRVFADRDNAATIVQGDEHFNLSTLIKFVSEIVDTMYIGSFRNIVNDGAGVHFDQQIGTGFVAQWNQWKSGPYKKQNRAIQLATEQVRLLIGAQTLEIAVASDNKTLHVTLDNRPHKLAELGSGIAQLILVLGSAMIRKPAFIAIDEPETHLHPGLQSEFLTALATYSKIGVVYATHSIGLARAISDRIFTVQRSKNRSIVRPFNGTPRMSEFLGSLGIAGLAEIGWDTILLVEGPKDVRTFQALLRNYQKDRRTVVLPLGGESMINGHVASELSEVVRLGGKIAALVDSERKFKEDSLSTARKGFLEICQNLDIACLVTDRRAIENYLPDHLIKRVFGASHNALDHYQHTRDSANFWGKGESWRVANLMSKDDLSATDVGQFLEKL